MTIVSKRLEAIVVSNISWLQQQSVHVAPVQPDVLLFKKLIWQLTLNCIHASTVSQITGKAILGQLPMMTSNWSNRVCVNVDKAFKISHSMAASKRLESLLQAALVAQASTMHKLPSGHLYKGATGSRTQEDEQE